MAHMGQHADFDGYVGQAVRAYTWKTRPPFKVIESDTIWSGTYDFLIVIRVTVGLSCTIYEIHGGLGRKTQVFFTPLHLTSTVEGLTIGIL